jgi:hypothetical protein
VKLQSLSSIPRQSKTLSGITPGAIPDAVLICGVWTVTVPLRILSRSNQKKRCHAEQTAQLKKEMSLQKEMSC